MHLLAQLVPKEVKWFTRRCGKEPLREMPEKSFVFTNGNFISVQIDCEHVGPLFHHSSSKETCLVNAVYFEL